METIENGFGGWVHDGLPVSRLTGYRENLLIPVMDRKKAVVSYKPMPAEM